MRLARKTAVVCLNCMMKLLRLVRTFSLMVFKNNYWEKCRELRVEVEVVSLK